MTATDDYRNLIRGLQGHTGDDLHDDLVPPTVGVDMRSKTLFYDPDGDIHVPTGGLYLETVDTPGWTGDGEYIDGIQYKVIGVHHGQPRWHLLDQDDIDWEAYTGLRRVDVIRSTIDVILRDALRNKDQRARHLTTMTRLESAL